MCINTPFLSGTLCPARIAVIVTVLQEGKFCIDPWPRVKYTFYGSLNSLVERKVKYRLIIVTELFLRVTDHARFLNCQY